MSFQWPAIESRERCGHGRYGSKLVMECSICSPQNFCDHVNAKLKEFGATRAFKGNCEICCPGGKEGELQRVREYRAKKQARLRAENQIRYDAIKARLRQEQQAST